MKKRLLGKKDFIWKEKKTNNIESNPLEYWYTTYDNGDVSRLYYIIPQYPSVDDMCVNTYENPELYIYFEAIGTVIAEGEVECKYSGIGNGYVYGKGSFKRAFKTIQEAKDRAYRDYKMVYGYAMSFIDDKGDANEQY